MEIDPFLLNVEPQSLRQSIFDVGDTGPAGLDFLVNVWDASEAITSPDLETRIKGFKHLEDMKAARISPLVSYLLVSKITEPDLDLRSRIVRMTAEVLIPDGDDQVASGPVRQYISAHLSQMRTRQIFALLQLVDFDPSSEIYVTRLLKTCSYAGNHLSEILLDRRMTVSIRKRAAYFIKVVGYLDAIPALERVASRLESRIDRLESVTAIKIDEEAETGLLPLVQDALDALKAP